MKNSVLLLLLTTLTLGAFAQEEVRQGQTSGASNESSSQEGFVVNVDHEGKNNGKNALKRRISIKSVARGVSKALEAISKDPLDKDSVWDLEFLHREEELSNILQNFAKGEYAAKAKSLNLENLDKKTIVATLVKEGFEKRESETTVDKMLGRTKDRDVQDAGEIYVHADGSMVRIKDFSSKRKYRPQAYLVKCALKNPSGPTTWQNEAFKITKEGYPIPKGPKQSQGMKVHAPFSSGPDEDKGWIDLIMEEAHIDIKPDIK